MRKNFHLDCRVKALVCMQTQDTYKVTEESRKFELTAKKDVCK